MLLWELHAACIVHFFNLDKKSPAVRLRVGYRDRRPTALPCDPGKPAYVVDDRKRNVVFGMDMRIPIAKAPTRDGLSI